MQGRVYRICIQGHSDNKPHPHVVILDCGDECLMIPCFGEGGHDLEERLELLEKRGIPRDVAAVRLDNAKHVKWKNGWTGKIGFWFVFRNAPLSKDEIQKSQHVGDMDPVGVRAVLEGLLSFAEARPEYFSKNRIRRLKALLK